jgi:hypothetical protein
MIRELLLVKTMEHNMMDKSRYNPKNIENIVKQYLGIATEKKEVYAVMDSDQEICLVRQNHMEKLPRNILAQDEDVLSNQDLHMTEYKECYSMAFRLYEEIVKKMYDQEKQKMESIIESAGYQMECKQPTFSYTKAIKKKMKATSKLFIDSNMDGYDFREIDLSDSIFINCSLKGANFSFVNMENTYLINSRTDGAIFYKAQTNNVVEISGEIGGM